MDADYGDALTLDSGSPEDVDEWHEAYDETEGGNAAGAVGEAIEETVDEALATAEGEAPPSSAAEKRQADPAPRRAAGGKRILFCRSISSAYSCPEGFRPTLIIISFRGMTIRNPL